MTASMGRATLRAPADKPQALKAPLFRLLVDDLDSAGRHVVLDLGAASTPMLSLLARSGCRVEIADLASHGGVERLNAETPAEELAEIAASLLPVHRDDADAVDIVLCWDLPNYLTPAGLSALMRAIAVRSHPGTLAHALIVYSERSMPERPGRFVPAEDSSLVNRGASTAEIKAPRYSPEDLGRIMGRFCVDRARLLANGMQEFLFRLRD